MPWMPRHLVVHPSDRAWLEELGLTSVDRVLAYRPSVVAAISGSSETFRIDTNPGTGAPAQIYIKRYCHRTFGARIKAAFRGGLIAASRARWEYEFLNEMRRRDVPTVRPIAYGERRHAGLLKACFLITEGAASSEPVDGYIQRRHGGSGIPANEQHRLVESLGRFIRRMHRAGVVHGGLFGRNILVLHGGAGDPDFLLLDPGRSGRLFRGKVPRRAIISDLSDLAATLDPYSGEGDGKRFAQAYCGAPCTTMSVDELLAALTQATRKKKKKELHRVAVGSTLHWLQRRVADSTELDRERPSLQFESVGAFFEMLTGAGHRPEMPDDRTKTVHFIFTETSDANGASHYTLTLGKDGLAYEEGLTGGPDLTVKTDPEAWLAIANGRSNAFDLLRDRRLNVEGETTLLALLAKLVDGAAERKVKD